MGYNLKATDIQAALGVAQLEKLDGFITKREENFKILYDGLKKYEKYFILPAWEKKARPSWFGFLLTVKEDAPFKRGELGSFYKKTISPPDIYSAVILLNSPILLIIKLSIE